jgi:hypothetical protein
MIRSPIQEVLPKYLKGFVVREANSDSEEARELIIQAVGTASGFCSERCNKGWEVFCSEGYVFFSQVLAFDIHLLQIEVYY